MAPYSQTKLALPRRHVMMPEIYEVENHPLLDGVDHVGKVYVGYVGTDKSSVKDDFDFEGMLKCPQGGIDEWEGQGLLRLQDGGYLFLRDPRVSKEPKDDMLAVMVTGSVHHQRAIDAFEKATQAMLGARNIRTFTSTAFERTRCAQKIQKKRCYSIGTAVQLSRRVVAPTASLASSRRNIVEYQEMVKDLIQSTSDMLLNVQDALPGSCVQAFAANSELTGQPGVGKRKVYGTSSIQVNISAAGLSASDNRLGDQLGDFGCEHYDGRDSADHLTTMFSNPDIPDGYAPGGFHILQLGVFIVLDKYVGVSFSGQRRHVGTAPTPPPGCPPVESAYRFNVVCYPKDAAVDGRSRFTLASLPGRKPTRKSARRNLAPPQRRKSKRALKATVAVEQRSEASVARHGDAGQRPSESVTEGGGWKQGATRVPGWNTGGDDGDIQVGNLGQNAGAENWGGYGRAQDEGEEGFEDADAGLGEGERGKCEGEGSDWEARESEWESDWAAEDGEGSEWDDVEDEGERDGGRTGTQKRSVPQGHQSGARARKPSELDPEPLYLTPEMINMSDEAFVTHTTNRATFARSGHIIMDRESHVTFMGRALHLLNAYVWRQLPTEYSISIDVKKMLESVTYDDEDGNRAHLGAWPSAPNVHGVSNERTENRTIWSAYQEKVRRFIPRIAYRAFDYDDDSSSEGDGSLDTGDDEDSAVADEAIDEEGSNGRRKEAKPKPLRGALAGPFPIENPLRELEEDDAENAGRAKQTYRPVRTREDGPHQLGTPLDTNDRPRKRTSKARKRAAPVSDTEQQHEGKRSRVESTAELAGSSPLVPTTLTTFPFLDNLTAQALQDEVEALRGDFAMVSKSLDTDNQSHVFRLGELASEYRSILQDPISYLAPNRIRHIQVQLRAYTIMNAMEAMNARRERYLVLLSSVHVWYWLDVVIKTKIEAIFKSGPTEAASTQHEDWLVVLVDSIRGGLLRRLDPIELDPEIHLSLLPLRSSVIRVSNSSKWIYLEHGTPQEQEHLRAAVVDKVQKVLMDCLQYPPESQIKDRRRAWLMGTLVDVIGEEFLATHYAWDAWNSFSVKGFLGGVPQAYGKNPDLIQPFRDALKAHPICVDGSDTWKAYQSFRQLLQDPSSTTISESVSHPHFIAPGVTTGIISTPSTQVRFDGLDGYLRGCIGFERGEILTESPLHQFLLSRPDIRLPFREKAPSRIRIRAGDTSPYHETAIRRDAGIYSAVVYRGITYNSLFSQHSDAPTLFEDFSDWERKIQEFRRQHPEASRTKNFFCRPDAYGGQSIVGRSVETASTFWEGVKALNWLEQTKRLMTFKECYDLFRKGNFPTMGVLCCYLLTCDLHYAGICRAPTISGVASIMRVLQGGSYRSMPMLGFWEVGTHPPQEVVMDALLDIQEHLTDAFNEEEKALMGLDLICVEHILCKFKRAVAAKVL